jgi:DNA-binding NarL/FixJ family response regulator
MPESGRQANPPVGRQFPRLQNDNLGLTERRDLIRGLTDEGVSQAEIARELGVSRQAVQKMLAV